MSGIFEDYHFLARKWLLSMIVGEERSLPVAQCSYASIRSTASQLKKMGVGEWRCSKKNSISHTKVLRIR